MNHHYGSNQISQTGSTTTTKNVIKIQDLHNLWETDIFMKKTIDSLTPF